MISNREKLIDEWLWECEDRGYILEDSSISMDNRRKYDYITNANEISINSTGITLSVDPPSLYTTIASRTTPAIEAIQVAHISPGDVILLKISDNIDVHECAEIMTEMKQAFPCN